MTVHALYGRELSTCLLLGDDIGGFVDQKNKKLKALILMNNLSWFDALPCRRIQLLFVVRTALLD